MEVNKENLLLSGFLSHPVPSLDTHWADEFMQKPVGVLGGTKYFIKIFYSKFGRWQSRCQMEKNGQFFNITLLPKEGQTVDDVELFFERVWHVMGCDWNQPPTKHSDV